MSPRGLPVVSISKTIKSAVAVIFMRVVLVFIVTTAATIITACSGTRTIVEPYYEFRPAETTDFEKPGDYSCGIADSKDVYRTRYSNIRVLLVANVVEENTGVLAFRYWNLFHGRHGGKLLSNTFVITAGDETLQIESEPGLTYYRSASFRVDIPLRFERFFLTLPEFELDGERHSIPAIEFRKTIAERKVTLEPTSFLCGW